MKIIFVLLALALVHGCAYQQAITGYEKVALDSAKAADDNILEINTVALCGTRYSTILRHPEIWSALPSLCAPGVRESTPATLLKESVK